MLVNVYKQLNLGAMIQDPITAKMIHSMGVLFLDNTNLYTWREYLLDPEDLWCQAQLELEQWSCLLNATGGGLKPKICFWYLLDYECMEGEWTYTETVHRIFFVTNPDGTKSPIKQEKVADSKKTLGIHYPDTGGNTDHLSYIKKKHAHGYIECRMDISQAILCGQHTNTNCGLA